MSDHPPIWFLRHGETTWNAARRIQGQLDTPLSDLGRAHAADQARILAPVLATGPDLIASPLSRASDTARIALGGRAFRTDPALMEIHAGDWQGRFYDDLLAERPDLDGLSALEIFADAPGGEGIAAFRARVAGVLAGLRRPTVIVAHGLWGQVLRGLVRCLPEDHVNRLDNLQGVVYALEGGRETILRAPAS